MKLAAYKSLIDKKKKLKQIYNVPNFKQKFIRLFSLFLSHNSFNVEENKLYKFLKFSYWKTKTTTLKS